MQIAASTSKGSNAAVLQILFAIGIGHFINDSMQAIVPALYPILQNEMMLSYTEIGWIAFVLNMTSSVLQPVFGLATDKKPMPFLLSLGMFLAFLGVISITFAPNFMIVLLSVIFIGLGSAIFHPEGSRVAYLASGTKRGLGQSIYQVGGNAGNAMAPILTYAIFLPFGQKGGIWISVLPLLGIFLLLYVGKWYKNKLLEGATQKTSKMEIKDTNGFTNNIKTAMILILFITFIRSWYVAGMGSFYQFYLIHDYGISIRNAQIILFAYLIAGVVGTLVGGALSDRFGKKNVIVFSMVASTPLAMVLPNVSIGYVVPIFMFVGFIMFSSFSIIVVYAQQLLPGKVGLVSGLVTGLAFGLGAIGSVALGNLADIYSVKFIMILCSLLPLIGLVSFFLPNDLKPNFSNKP